MGDDQSLKKAPPVTARPIVPRPVRVAELPLMGVAKYNGQTLRITLYDSGCDEYDNGTFDAKP